MTKLSADIAGAKQVRSALKRLLKAGARNQQCVCCLRAMSAAELKVHNAQMKKLVERQSAEANEEKRRTIEALEKKQREIKAHLDDWRKWKTLSASTGSGSVAYAKAAHEKLKQRASEKKIELDEAKRALEMATTEHDHAQLQSTDVVVIANKHRSADQARKELEDLEESQVCPRFRPIETRASSSCRAEIRTPAVRCAAFRSPSIFFIVLLLSLSFPRAAPRAIRHGCPCIARRSQARNRSEEAQARGPIL